MISTRRLSVISVVLACLLQAQGADKYSDENRPYEFGFTIPEEQHRHEKKDENGLIEGEFGFITADGVYHVTVYATDENGNFKILSMKNIRVKPYPTSPERKGKEITFPAPENKPPRAQEPQEPQVSLEEPVRSCSHCSIPTTPKPVVENEYPQYPQGVVNAPSYPIYPAENYPQNPENYPLDNYPDIPREPGLEYVDPLGVQYRDPLIQGERNPKQFYPEEPVSKPELIYAQMQIVDPNTDIYAKKPGEQDGLPLGLNTNDMKLILYTFNYTVGFHGHHEVGYTDGTKQGYYFVTGRNGVRTRVDYEADEKGFRPKITQEVLDLISEDIPKPETEKDPKYGLKGYEFKWLYYPVDSKRR